MTGEDPFATLKVPSVSWRDVPVGGIISMVVTRAASKTQSRDYETNQPSYWDDAKTQPKYSAVVNGIVYGEERSIWAQIPSSLFAAISDAQKASGQRIDVGGTLLIRRLEDKPNMKNPKLNAAKQFAAKYEPPAVGSDEPPF